MKSRLIWFFITLCFLIRIGYSQETFGGFPGGANKSPVRASLASSHDVIAAGQPFYLALDFAIDPEWHTYWINPGEIGEATQLELTLPSGFQSEPLRFPLPHRYVQDFGNDFKLGSYTYSKSATHTVKITPPENLKPGEKILIKGNATWLMCKESCIPGNQDLEIELQTGPAGTKSTHAQRIEQALSGQPVKTGWTTTLGREGETLTATVNVGDDLPEGTLEFFPLQASVFSVSKDMTTSREANTVTVTGSAADGLTDLPEKLDGLLVAKLADGSEKGFFVGSSDDSESPGTAPGTVDQPTVTGSPPAPFGGGFLGILFAGFLGGMILNIMPCVFPVISLKILSFVMQAGEDRKKIFLHSAVFAGGVLVFFAILAIGMIILRNVGGSVSWGEQMQYPIFAIFLISIMVLIALMLFGVFELGTGMTSVGGKLTAASGYSGSFWNGALAVLLATPCTAPLLAPAAAIALTQPAGMMALFFLVVGLGMAFPYLLLGYFPKLLDFLPKPGRWMETFKQVMGFPMLAVAVWLIGSVSKQLETSGLQWALGGVLIMAIAAWIFGRYVRPEQTSKRRWGGRMTALGVFVLGCVVAWNASGRQAENSSQDIAQIIEGHREAGKNVFVDFTAEWCVTCKANKRIAINRKETKDAFASNNIEFVTADFTNKDPRIQKILSKHGRAGVPLYLLYPSDTDKEAVSLKDGIITSQDILDAIELIK